MSSAELRSLLDETRECAAPRSAWQGRRPGGDPGAAHGVDCACNGAAVARHGPARRHGDAGEPAARPAHRLRLQRRAPHRLHGLRSRRPLPCHQRLPGSLRDHVARHGGPAQLESAAADREAPHRRRADRERGFHARCRRGAAHLRRWHDLPRREGAALRPGLSARPGTPDARTRLLRLPHLELLSLQRGAHLSDRPRPARPRRLGHHGRPDGPWPRRSMLRANPRTSIRC